MSAPIEHAIPLVPEPPQPTTPVAPPPRPHRLRNLLLLGAAVLAGGVWMIARSGSKPTPPPAETSGAANGSGDAAAWQSVQLGKAVAAKPRWTDPVSARVVMDESRTSRIGSPLDGRVTAVMVQRGQKVKAGTPLFTVSSPGLAELRADRDIAVVEEATARANLERTQALIDTKFAPGKDLLEAQQRLAEAQVAVRLAQSKLAALRVSSNGDGSFTVTAPRDGVVVERNVDLGQQVSNEAGGLIVVADLASVWVVVDLFEQDVGNLAPGVPAKVVLASDPSVERDGKVENVSPVIDPDRNTVPVRVRLDNLDGALRPHSYAQVRFLDPSPAPVEVPASAVLSDGATSYVYVPKKGGGFERRDVVAGAPEEGAVPIFQGLAIGDDLVCQGGVLLDNQLDNLSSVVGTPGH